VPGDYRDAAGIATSGQGLGSPAVYVSDEEDDQRLLEGGRAFGLLRPPVLAAIAQVSRVYCQRQTPFLIVTGWSGGVTQTKLSALAVLPLPR